MTDALPADPQVTALLEQLGQIAERVDPPPPLVYELARAALATRALDEELAELVRDSAADAEELVGVRGAGDVRLLAYESEGLDIELQLTARGERRSLLGQIIGSPVGAVRVETARGQLPVPVDRTGFFELADLPVGRFRLRLVAEDGTPVTTSWVTA